MKMLMTVNYCVLAALEIVSYQFPLMLTSTPAYPGPERD